MANHSFGYALPYFYVSYHVCVQFAKMSHFSAIYDGESAVLYNVSLQCRNSLYISMTPATNCTEEHCVFALLLILVSFGWG